MAGQRAQPRQPPLLQLSLLLRLAERRYRGTLSWAVHRWWQQSSLKAVARAAEKELCEADRGGGPPADLQANERAELLAELRAAQDVALEVSAREAARSAAAAEFEVSARVEQERLRAELGEFQAQLHASGSDDSAARHECEEMRLELGAARAELRGADVSEVDLFEQPGDAGSPQEAQSERERETLLSELLAVQAEAAESAAAEAALARAASDFEAQAQRSELQAQEERQQLQAELNEARVELAESPGRPSPRSDGSSSPRNPLDIEMGEDRSEAATAEPMHRAEVHMTVENVDYGLLSADPSLLAAFRSAVTEAITSEAGQGIERDHVELALSAGSVVVHAAIRPPAGVSAQDLHSTLESSETLHESVADMVTDVEGIHEVSTGAIVVSKVYVALVVVEVAAPSPRARGRAVQEEFEEMRNEMAALQRSEVELLAVRESERLARLEAEEVRQLQVELQEELSAAQSGRSSQKPNQSACCDLM